MRWVRRHQPFTNATPGRNRRRSSATYGRRVTLLSVIIPCHNVADHLLQTLRSLQANAHPGFEFLFVDDASTDATSDLLVEHTRDLPGARVVTLHDNVGLAGARNAGLDAASGTYLTFLDGGDFLAAGYLTDLVATIGRLGCELVRTDHMQVRGRRRSVHRICHGPRGIVMSPRDAILPVGRPTSVDAPHAWSGIYSRRLLDEGLLHFQPELRTCEDRPWNWRLHLRAPSFAVVGLLGVFYRRGVPNSLTQIVDERQLDFLPAHRRILALVSADPDAERLLPKAVRAFCAILCHHLSRSARLTPALAERLRASSAQDLRTLPPGVVHQVLAGLDPQRRTVLEGLQAA
jgi:hypothetical protein